MKIFIAGSTGTIGKSLVPLLLKNGHEVVALVRSPEKAKEVEAVHRRRVFDPQCCRMGACALTR